MVLNKFKLYNIREQKCIFRLSASIDTTTCGRYPVQVSWGEFDIIETKSEIEVESYALTDFSLSTKVCLQLYKTGGYEIFLLPY